MLETVVKEKSTPPSSQKNARKTNRNTTRRSDLLSIIAKLPPDSRLILQNQTWESYEKLLDALGEASGLRVSFAEGKLEIMTLSTEHESLAEMIGRFVDRISIIKNVDILFFGSATIKKSRRITGSEPDACFYIQNAAAIGGKIKVDFAIDPPPDVVAEIDWKHDSFCKFPIYAALGVPEIWRYDGHRATFYQLENAEKYVEIQTSIALPMLTAKVLGNFLNRNGKEAQPQILRDFQDWLTKTV